MHLNLDIDKSAETIERLLIKTGNRELVSLDFRWILVPQINETSLPEELVVIERRTNGNFYGYIEDIILDGQSVGQDKMAELVERVSDFQAEMEAASKI